MKFGAKKRIEEAMKTYQNFGIYDFSDYAEEIKSNPQAYAYYKALQGQARSEGNTGKYKGYNVLGVGNIKGEVKPIMGEHVYSEYFINKYVPEQYRVDATTYAFDIY